MPKPVILGIVFVLLILGVIVYSTLTLAGHRVEVCMEYQGRTNCRIARGSTEDFTLRTAIQNACAGIASGVTDSMACEHNPPTKVTWLK